MKKLHFLYEMELSFDYPATDHYFQFKCVPVTDQVQRCEKLEYQITPAGSCHEWTDWFGNRICSGETLEPHNSLKVVSEGIVKIDLEQKRREAVHPVFKYPSDYTQPDGGIIKLYQHTLEKSQNQGVGFVLDLMQELNYNFIYQAGSTDVRTTAAQALEQGQGVCQDYAHILISMCRAAHIPARYVAGMMIGEGATHAWVEVWLDGSWVGVDPTHGCLVNEGYIKLSHGRDFGDCTVDKGCFRGSADQRQKIYVKVEECHG